LRVGGLVVGWVVGCDDGRMGRWMGGYEGGGIGGWQSVNGRVGMVRVGMAPSAKEVETSKWCSMSKGTMDVDKLHTFPLRSSPHTSAPLSKVCQGAYSKQIASAVYPLCAFSVCQGWDKCQGKSPCVSHCSGVSMQRRGCVPSEWCWVVITSAV